MTVPIYEVENLPSQSVAFVHAGILRSWSITVAAVSMSKDKTSTPQLETAGMDKLQNDAASNPSSQTQVLGPTQVPFPKQLAKH